MILLFVAVFLAVQLAEGAVIAAVALLTFFFDRLPDSLPMLTALFSTVPGHGGGSAVLAGLRRGGDRVTSDSRPAVPDGNTLRDCRSDCCCVPVPSASARRSVRYA